MIPHAKVKNPTNIFNNQDGHEDTWRNEKNLELSEEIRMTSSVEKRLQCNQLSSCLIYPLTCVSIPGYQNYIPPYTLLNEYST